MKNISIIVPVGDGSLTNIEGTHQILNEVNSLLAREGRSPAFNVQLVGLHKEMNLRKGLFSVHPDALIKDVTSTDLIIVPALFGEMNAALDRNKEYIPWLIDQYHKGAVIASLCIGSFLVAATGLLDGKKCATHWASAEQFRKMFPKVNLVPDQVITGEYGIYSSGGAYSALNLILYLIEKYAGRDMSILCSKLFQIEIERNSQSAFMIFNAQKDHEDEQVKKAQDIIEQNFQEKITIEQLAAATALSRRNFERRFKNATRNTVIEYLQRVKIEAAKKSLETSRKNVNEIMYEVGYSDIKAFRTTFKRITGISPIEYKNKYNKELVTL